MDKFIEKVFSYPPKTRKLIIFSIDLLLIIFALKISFSRNINTNSGFYNQNTFYFFVILFNLLLNHLAGNYKSLTRYINSAYFYRNLLTTFSSVLIVYILNFLIFNNSILFKEWFFLFFFILSLTTITRVILRDTIFKLQNINEKNRSNVVIFGAGDAGVALYENLTHSKKFNVLGFVDDSLNKAGRTINNIPIYSRKFIKKNNKTIDLVLLAIPSLKKEEKKKLVSDISKFGCRILQIPTLRDLNFRKEKIDFMNPIEIEDLLGREIVNAELDSKSNIIFGQNICVTGAGGSIGSELCEQIIFLKPKRLILFEISEPSLYFIFEKLKEIKNLNVEIIPVLGNCSDEKLLKRTLLKNKVSVIFHAAAYKHVSLVQQNSLQGISNNFISTNNICKVAFDLNIRKFVLISSDKAVRPTSIMGLSKRLSELVVLSFASKVISQEDKNTIFSMVRFGNVLGSSGSVVPLFKKQIKQGGPITITHPEVIRYFMTISEAANLVIQAGSLSQGGELFLLDMGKPVKILDLAKQMINLSGLAIKDEKNPRGEIEIVFVGLRDGEKLYEELLIDGSPLKTKHPLIFIANESNKIQNNLSSKFDELELHLKDQNEKLVFHLISQIVPEWKYKKNYL